MGDFLKKPEPLRTDEHLSDNWKKFKRNFDIYLEAAELTNKTDTVKVSVFLNIIGSDAMQMFDTFQLTDEQRKNYAAVTKAFADFCEPKKNEVYERYVFYQRKQKDGENFDTFLMDIKRLVKYCEFKEKENEMLRDQIVMGVSDKKLQLRLLGEVGLTYERAVEKSRASETTREQSQTMNGANSTTVNVNEMSKQGNNNKKSYDSAHQHKKSTSNRTHTHKHQNRNERNDNRNTNKSNNVQRAYQHRNHTQNSKNNSNNNGNENRNCKFCNYQHQRGNCPAYGKNCRNCSKLNHFESVCKFKNVSAINANDFDNNSDLYIHSLTNVDALECNAATGVVQRPVWKENIIVKNKLVSFKVDTGSDVTAIPRKLFEKIAPGWNLGKSTSVLRAFGGQMIQPIGMCSLDCVYNGLKKRIEIEIVDFDTVPLLGLVACIAFGLVDIKKIEKNNKGGNFL